jgi:hypothetical protein
MSNWCFYLKSTHPIWKHQTRHTLWQDLLKSFCQGKNIKPSQYLNLRAKIFFMKMLRKFQFYKVETLMKWWPFCVNSWILIFSAIIWYKFFVCLHGDKIYNSLVFPQTKLLHNLIVCKSDSLAFIWQPAKCSLHMGKNDVQVTHCTLSNSNSAHTRPKRQFDIWHGWQLE